MQSLFSFLSGLSLRRETPVHIYSLHLGVALKTLIHIVQCPQLAIILLEVHRICPNERHL